MRKDSIEELLNKIMDGFGLNDENEFPVITCTECGAQSYDYNFHSDPYITVKQIRDTRILKCPCCKNEMKFVTHLHPTYTMEGRIMPKQILGFTSLGSTSNTLIKDITNIDLSDYQTLFNYKPNVKNCNNIFGLFDDYDYPNNDMLLNGLKEGQMFSYVSSTYLNGLINYVSVFHTIMIRRYKKLKEDIEGRYNPEDDTCWEDCVEEVNKYMSEGGHTDYARIKGGTDDILLLAEGEDGCYWLFWDDQDCSDCCVGKIPKSICSKEELIDCLHRTVPNIGNEYDEYVVLSNPRGWVTF